MPEITDTLATQPNICATTSFSRHLWGAFQLFPNVLTMVVITTSEMWMCWAPCISVLIMCFPFVFPTTFNLSIPLIMTHTKRPRLCLLLLLYTIFKIMLKLKFCSSRWCSLVANRKLASSIPSRGTCLGCRFGPRQSVCRRQPTDASLPLFFSPFPSF